MTHNVQQRYFGRQEAATYLESIPERSIVCLRRGGCLT